MKSFTRYSSRYYYNTWNLSHDMLYKNSKLKVFFDFRLISISYFSWWDVSLSASFFSNILIRSWYSSDTNDYKSTYDFEFKTFSISFMITVKILWSCFHASTQNDSVFIWQISSKKCLLSSSNIFLWFFAFNLSWLYDVNCVVLSDNDNSYYVVFK